jgi:hypothetical protein
MRKQTLCYFVIGTSLAVLLQRLAQRRTVTHARPVSPRSIGAEVIDLATWKQSRDLETVGAAAK